VVTDKMHKNLVKL